jgi:hypothetical protein
MARSQEFVEKTIPPARKARRTKKTNGKPAHPATLTADELLEYKVRMIMFATVRDAYAMWVRAVKNKYKIDQQAVLDIEAGTGKLYVRKQAREAVQADG